jgi:hypothetical protein
MHGHTDIKNVLSNSASAIGIITVVGKPWRKEMSRNDIAELMSI